MKAFLIGGGAMVKATTEYVANDLKEMCDDVYTTEDAEHFRGRFFSECDLLVLNSCLWTGSGHSISQEAREAFHQHFVQGKGAVFMHSSIGNWNDWPNYIRYVGAIWKWGHSSHTKPDSTFSIVRVDEHPLLEGVPDCFQVTDEMYYNLEFVEGNHVIARTSEADGGHPMVWHRQTLNSRVAAIMIGHDVQAVQHPQYKQLLRNACKWTTGGDLK